MDLIRFKNRLLAAVYSDNTVEFKRIYKSFAKTIKNKGHLSEEEQKAVNQIRCAVRRFSKKKNFPFFDGFPETKRQIRKKMAGVVRRQIHAPLVVEHDVWRKRLGIPEFAYPIMLKTTAIIQLSTGCSNACRRCNEWALPGPRKHFSFHAAKILLRDMARAGNAMFSLYGASDPLDWKSNDHDITDLLSFMKDNGYQTEFGLLTKIPKGTEPIAEKLLIRGNDVAVSITSKNRATVKAIEIRSGKKFAAQHDVEELDIPSGMDEDFSSIKSSITDYYGTEITPEGASLVIPAFTSALNPTGQKRITVTPATNYFLAKRTGRDALSVEYFKPLDVVGISGGEYTLEALIEVQVENILLDTSDESITPPGMMNLREYFRTFEKDAVLQRKKLMHPAIKAIKKNVFQKRGRGAGNKNTSIKRFKRLASSYLDACDLERIIPYKTAAFSFFLASVSGYLETHPAERDIVLFLRQDDRQTYKPSLRDIASELRQPDSDLFHIFQTLLFRLLEDHRDDLILDFINKHPARYDPEIDRFIIQVP